MLYLTESPRWLVRHDREKEAWGVLDRLSPRQADQEMARIRRSLEEERQSGARVSFRGGYGMTLLVGVALASLQQFDSKREIVIADPAVGNMRFTGTIFTNRISDWLTATEKVFSLRQEEGKRGRVLLDAKQRR
jgi:ferric-dicitrate binding protein FerR (iron transport regulator)